jgi:hypothetical protein
VILLVIKAVERGRGREQRGREQECGAAAEQ